MSISYSNISTVVSQFYEYVERQAATAKIQIKDITGGDTEEQAADAEMRALRERAVDAYRGACAMPLYAAFGFEAMQIAIEDDAPLEVFDKAVRVLEAARDGASFGCTIASIRAKILGTEEAIMNAQATLVGARGIQEAAERSIAKLQRFMNELNTLPAEGGGDDNPG